MASVPALFKQMYACMENLTENSEAVTLSFSITKCLNQRVYHRSLFYGKVLYHLKKAL